MIPIRDNRVANRVPVVTWTLILLNCVIYLWDRQGQLFGQGIVFTDLALKPREVTMVIQGRWPDSFPLVTVFTSMFLHANLLHLVGNLIFLFVFGSGVENALGGPRLALYYLAWGVFAMATHIWVNPYSPVATLGASGAIGGVLGCYFLLFPAHKIEIVVPILAFMSFVVSAWIVLGLWFLYQILIPQYGVANWAHAGGFLAGMLTVLVMGGRHAILKGREHEFDPEED